MSFARGNWKPRRGGWPLLVVCFLLALTAAFSSEAFRRGALRCVPFSADSASRGRPRGSLMRVSAEGEEDGKKGSSGLFPRTQKGVLLPKNAKTKPLPPHVQGKFVFARLPERIKRLYTRVPLSEAPSAEDGAASGPPKLGKSFDEEVEKARALAEYPWPNGAFLRLRVKATRKDDLLETLRRFEGAVRNANKTIWEKLSGNSKEPDGEESVRFPAFLLSVAALPVHRRVITLLKSPFKDKDSRDQFEYLTRKFLLDIHLTPMLLRHLEAQRRRHRERPLDLREKKADGRPFESFRKLRSLTSLAKRRLKHSLFPLSSGSGAEEPLRLPRRGPLSPVHSEKEVEKLVFEELEKLPLDRALKASEKMSLVRLPAFVLAVTLPDRVATAANFELYVHPEKLARSWKRADMRCRWLSKFAKYKRELPLKDAIVEELLSPELRRHFQLRWPQSVWDLRSQTLDELQKMLRTAKQSLAESKASVERGEAPFQPKKKVFGDFLPLHEADDGRHFLAKEAKLFARERFPLECPTDGEAKTQSR